MTDTAAVLTLALSLARAEPAGRAAPAVVVMSEPMPVAAAPDVVIDRTPAPEGQAAAPLPVVETDLAARGCPHPVAASASLSLVASMLLHVGAAAAFAWLSWTMPPPISAGEEGIPVELVVAAETGSASQQEAASGRRETETPSSDSQAVQKVEAPPAETPPVPAAREPVETAAVAPPVAQPDPSATAERILDQMPQPPMPDHLPIIDTPAEPVLADARSAPVREEPVPQPQPVQERAPVAETPPTAPLEALQKVETQAPTEVQAAVAPQPVETPPPAPVVQPPPPPRPPVRREATRPPPTRREVPTTRERRRPTREVATAVQPERPVRAAPQAESRASVAERGEGAGQRNRQQSSSTGTSGASSVAAVAAWRQRVLAHLARHKVYPESARERGIRGRTGIAFTLTGSGAVVSVSIASSSGAPILDQATLAMVRRAQPFPPNPAGGSASFTAGVNYNLH